MGCEDPGGGSEVSSPKRMEMSSKICECFPPLVALPTSILAVTLNCLVELRAAYKASRQWDSWGTRKSGTPRCHRVFFFSRWIGSRARRIVFEQVMETGRGSRINSRRPLQFRVAVVRKREKRESFDKSELLDRPMTPPFFFSLSVRGRPFPFPRSGTTCFWTAHELPSKSKTRSTFALLSIFLADSLVVLDCESWTVRSVGRK